MVRLPLSRGDWIAVKAALNAGEHDALFDKCMVRDDTGAPVLGADNKPRLDPTRSARAMLFAYLLDWSFADDDGHVVEIKQQPAAIVESAVDALDFDSRVEILTAITEHDARIRAARAEEKKRLAGSTAFDSTSRSLVGVAGGTNG